MKDFIKNISRYGDMVAIPLFALLSYYFYTIENKTNLEYVLYAFSISGVILDTLYTYQFLNKQQ